MMALCLWKNKKFPVILLIYILSWTWDLRTSYRSSLSTRALGFGARRCKHVFSCLFVRPRVLTTNTPRITPFTQSNAIISFQSNIHHSPVKPTLGFDFSHHITLKHNKLRRKVLWGKFSFCELGRKERNTPHLISYSFPHDQKQAFILPFTHSKTHITKEFFSITQVKTSAGSFLTALPCWRDVQSQASNQVSSDLFTTLSVLFHHHTRLKYGRNAVCCLANYIL